MFSRSTAPMHWGKGSDSTGRHTRCCLIRASASAGVTMISRARPPTRRPCQDARLLRWVLLVVGLQLLIEALDHRRHFVERRVIPFDQLAIELRLLRFDGLLLLVRLGVLLHLRDRVIR